MGFLVGIAVVVVVLLVAAAVHDWRARRTGNETRTTREYWDRVRDARREARNDRAAGFLLGASRKPKRR